MDRFKSEYLITTYIIGDSNPDKHYGQIVHYRIKLSQLRQKIENIENNIVIWEAFAKGEK